MALANFSSDDLRVLRDVIDKERERRQNAPSRPYAGRSWEESQDFPASNVLLVVPIDTIPARTEQEPDDSVRGDDPGRGFARIVQLSKRNTSDSKLVMPEEGYRIDLHNHTLESLDAGVPILAARDKAGVWWPVTTAPASDFILFRIASADTDNCQATADVLGRPPGVTSVPGEDDNGQVTVYDALCCTLDEDDSDLEGRMGGAVRLTLDYSYSECCTDSYGIPVEEPIWVIWPLCCPPPCA